MFDQISAAVSSLQAAGTIASGMLSLKTEAQVQAKAIELNQKIIAAQHDIFAAQAEQGRLIERVRALETELERMKAWNAQKGRYQLVSPFDGATLYALRREASAGEPAHYICPSCYNNGIGAILQNKASGNGTVFACSVCKAEVLTGYRGRVKALYAEEVASGQSG